MVDPVVAAAIPAQRDAPPSRRLDALLAEHKAVRDEILVALQGQRSILNFGVSTIALLFAAAGVVDQKAAKVAILCGVVPLAAVLITTLWSCELVRMARAGTYMVPLEGEINALPEVGEDAIQWEEDVNPLDRDSMLPSMDTLQRHVVAITFALLGIASATLGTVYSVQSFHLPATLHLWGPIVWVGSMMFVSVVVWQRFDTDLEKLKSKHRQDGTRRVRFGRGATC